jgi:hypothetical protein
MMMSCAPYDMRQYKTVKLFILLPVSSSVKRNASLSLSQGVLALVNKITIFG